MSEFIYYEPMDADSINSELKKSKRIKKIIREVVLLMIILFLVIKLHLITG